MEYIVAAIVAYGVVPPVISGAFHKIVEEVHCVLGEVAAYDISGVHYFNVLVQRASVGWQWPVGLCLDPQAGVVGGAYDEVGYVAFLFNEVLVEAVEQFYLAYRVCAFAFDVIEEQGE